MKTETTEVTTIKRLQTLILNIVYTPFKINDKFKSFVVFVDVGLYFIRW